MHFNLARRTVIFLGGVGEKTPGRRGEKRSIQEKTPQPEKTGHVTWNAKRTTADLASSADGTPPPRSAASEVPPRPA